MLYDLIKLEQKRMNFKISLLNKLVLSDKLKKIKENIHYNWIKQKKQKQ